MRVVVEEDRRNKQPRRQQLDKGYRKFEASEKCRTVETPYRVYQRLIESYSNRLYQRRIARLIVKNSWDSRPAEGKAPDIVYCNMRKDGASGGGLI